MSWLNLDTFAKLLGSWALLFSLTIVASALWLFPSDWIFDNAVAEARDQYRGYIGLAAVTLGLLLIAKVLIKCLNFGYKVTNAIPEKFRKKRKISVLRKKILKQISKIDRPGRDFLLNCLRSGNRKFELPPDDARVRTLHHAGVISCVDYDKEKSEFEIHQWVWKELEETLSLGNFESELETLSGANQALEADAKKPRG